VEDKSKYLGLILDEHLNMTEMANTLASSASKALGYLNSKYYNAKEMTYEVYSQMYYATVVPIMDYASEIWGHKLYEKIETVHNRAAKTFLGVGKYCPTPQVLADMGWYNCQFRRKIKMLKFLNRLLKTNEDRILKRLFYYDYHIASTSGKSTWCKDIKQIFIECNMLDAFENLLDTNSVDLVTMEGKLKDSYLIKWNNDRLSMSKLDVYNSLFNDIQVRDYVKCKFISRRHRSLIAQAISGTLPIELERGRWRNLPRARRLCKQCENGEIETLEHFLFSCAANEQHRIGLIPTETTTVELLNNQNIKDVAKIIYIAMQKRK